MVFAGVLAGQELRQRLDLARYFRSLHVRYRRARSYPLFDSTEADLHVVEPHLDVTNDARSSIHVSDAQTWTGHEAFQVGHAQWFSSAFAWGHAQSASTSVPAGTNFEWRSTVGNVREDSRSGTT